MIEQIREDIKQAFGNLTFDEYYHTYKINNQILPSVSSKVKSHYHEFKSKEMAEICAMNYNKDKPDNEKKTSKDFLNEWFQKSKLAREKGTKIHKFASKYPNFDTPVLDEQHAIIKFYEELPSNYEVVLLEFPLHSDTYAGTPDKILYNKKTRKLTISDWKGLPLDTPILTNNGWKTINTLKQSDMVFDKDGRLVKVKNISKIHNNPCYRIKFDNAESIIADHEHRWLVSFQYNGKFEDKIMTTEEIAVHLQTVKRHPSTIPKIRNPKPLNLPTKKLSIDPYILGLWLGDGSKRDGRITNMNPAIWQKITEAGYKLGKPEYTGKAQTRTLIGLSAQLKALGLINNKHIPDEYYLSSYDQRLSLLRGFMDTDGYYNKTRKRCAASTTRRWQVEAFEKLVGTLGWKTSTFPIMKKCNGKKIQSWDVCFTTDGTNPFLVRNQNIIFPPKKNNHLIRNIESIELTTTIPTKCIEVDSPSHTFLAGKTLIVTHNTGGDLLKNYKGQRLKEPFTGLLDTPFNRYSIQQSHYKILLESKTPYKVEECWLIHLPDKTYNKYIALDLSQQLKEYDERATCNSL